MDKNPLAADHPIKGGIAPGIAPTKIEIVETLLSGVYDKTYNKSLERLSSK